MLEFLATVFLAFEIIGSLIATLVLVAIIIFAIFILIGEAKFQQKRDLELEELYKKDADRRAKVNHE